MADSYLTLAHLRGLIDRFETEKLIGDVDSFLRFGEGNFRAMQLIRDGGVIAVPDRESADKLVAAADPGGNASLAGSLVGARIAILPWLPVGSAFVISRDTWEVRQESRRRLGKSPEPTL